MFCFNEHVDAPTAADADADADSTVEGGVEDRYGGVVVGIFDGMSVGVENGGPPSVEDDVEDAEVVDEVVGCESRRLGSFFSAIFDAIRDGDAVVASTTTLTLLTSGSSSDGQERASATRFAFPSTYLMSVVYSEMHDNWYCCLIVCGSDFLWIKGTRL